MTTLRATKNQAYASTSRRARWRGDAVMARRVAQARAEAHRSRRLHEACGRVAGAGDLGATMGELAAAGAQLTSASSARCCTVVDDGTWWGVEVRDGRRRPLDPLAAARLAALGGAAEEGLVVVTSGGEAPVVLAVGGAEPGAADVLDALLLGCSPLVAHFREIERLRAALGQTDELVAAVSHELRTPLAVVLGSLQTLRRLGTRVPVEARDELLATAEGGANRLLRLLEDLLLTASGQHGALRAAADVVEPLELLQSVAADVRATGGPPCAIDAADHVPAVVTDHDKLRRIVTNLVENAGKYAPGSVVELGITTEGEDLVVTVADHGPGIARADRARVFQPFVRLDQGAARRGGTGLGLHLCRTMTDVLGGRLSLDDRPDGASGAHFTLHLPIVVPAHEPALGVGGHP